MPRRLRRADDGVDLMPTRWRPAVCRVDLIEAEAEEARNGSRIRVAGGRLCWREIWRREIAATGVIGERRSEGNFVGMYLEIVINGTPVRLAP